MRSVFVALLVLPSLLAGCLTESQEQPDPIETEREQEPAPEPWTRRLFLLFPDPCPEEPIGNTTYEDLTDAFPDRECGKGPSEFATTPPPCATFIVHDSEYRLYKGQHVSALVNMEAGPGPDEIRLAWVDDEGVVAEGMAEALLSVGRGWGDAETTTTVQRNSTTGLRFEVHAENFSCGRVRTGQDGSGASAIWVEEG